MLLLLLHDMIEPVFQGLAINELHSIILTHVLIGYEARFVTLVDSHPFLDKPRFRKSEVRGSLVRLP